MRAHGPNEEKEHECIDELILVCVFYTRKNRRRVKQRAVSNNVAAL